MYDNVQNVKINYHTKKKRFLPFMGFPEVREILKPPSYFNFEHEIHKIRIPVPLSELVKHEDFKKSLTNLLLPEPLLPPQTPSICKMRSQQSS
jgi:hypothetical protein